jgi:hypothetical protein
MCLETVKTLFEILSILAAGWWFLYTTQFKPRLQFDVELHTLSLRSNSNSKIVELVFIFENKGFVEHRIWKLNVSVHALASETELKSKPNINELVFTERLLPQTQLVPANYGYYFVRPGVRQAIIHIIAIPSSVSVVRVTASFDYNQNDRYPHTVRRVFAVERGSEPGLQLPAHKSH